MTGHPDKALGLLPIVVRMIRRSKKYETTPDSDCRLGFAFYTLLNITAVQCSIEEQQRVYDAVFLTDGLLYDMFTQLIRCWKDECGYYIMGALANICRTCNEAHLALIAKCPELFDVIKEAIAEDCDVEEHAPEFLLANLAGGGEEMLQLIIDSKIFTVIEPLYYFFHHNEDDEAWETHAEQEKNRCSKLYVTYVNAIRSASYGQMTYLLGIESLCVDKVFSDSNLDILRFVEFKVRERQCMETVSCVIAKTEWDELQRERVLELFKTHACMMVKGTGDMKLWLKEYKEGGYEGGYELGMIFAEVQPQEGGELALIDDGDRSIDAGEFHTEILTTAGRKHARRH